LKLSFFKMHAQGNDYIYFDFTTTPQPDIDFSQLSRDLSPRNFGVGSDGIVIILPHPRYDGQMRIFNADGSEGRMCGSALRCVTVYLARKTGKKRLEIDTLSGLKIGTIMEQNCAEVDMGRIGFLHDKPVEIMGLNGHTVTVGNHHFVRFEDSLEPDIARKRGPGLEKNMLFPGGVNIEFVQVLTADAIRIAIWERGSGATLACGTGACAAAFAGMQKKHLNSRVKVYMPGGMVTVRFADKHAFLAGDVVLVFSGSIDR